MSEPTHHSALEGMGFKLASQKTGTGGTRGREGRLTRSYYTLMRNSLGLKGGELLKGGIVSPITHEVAVDDYHDEPGKYDVRYSLTQDGKPYHHGDFDWFTRHQDLADRGSPDPIKTIMKHHGAITHILDKERTPPNEFADIDASNVHTLAPSSHHWQPGWDEDEDYDMKKQRRMVTRPRQDMTYLNSVEPLDVEVARRLKGVGFVYGGRFPNDDPEDTEETDMYYRTHPYPASPETFNVNFTIRHKPSSPHSPYSYSARRVQSGVNDDGSTDPGSSIDVTGNSNPVATFDTINKVIARHNAVKDALGIRRKASSEMAKTASEFDDVIKGSGYAGPCLNCGKATYDYPEGTSFRDDKSYPLTAKDDGGSDMHGPDINLCGPCSADSDAYNFAVQQATKGRGRPWHYNDQGVPGCPECESHLMDEADEDLQP